MKALTPTNDRTVFKKVQRRSFDNILDWFMTAIAVTGFDKFAMTDEEVRSFMHNVEETADSIVNNYCSVEDLKQMLKDDYNFSITLSEKRND